MSTNMMSGFYKHYMFEQLDPPFEGYFNSCSLDPTIQYCRTVLISDVNGRQLFGYIRFYKLKSVKQVRSLKGLSTCRTWSLHNSSEVELGLKRVRCMMGYHHLAYRTPTFEYRHLCGLNEPLMYDTVE